MFLYFVELNQQYKDEEVYLVYASDWWFDMFNVFTYQVNPLSELK